MVLLPPCLSERVIFLDKIKGKAHIGSANLFFIELVIVLLFFSFSSAVILRIFAAADHKQEMSDLTESTVICAQSMAEAFSVSGSLSETAELVFGIENEFGSNGEIKLSKSLEHSENGAVTLFLSQENNETDAGRLSYLTMKFVYDGDEIYSLKCAAYIPEKEAEANG